MENRNLVLLSLINFNKMTFVLENKIGLKLEHVYAKPLFEKIYFPPDYGSKEISRLYPDGSLYFFIEKEGKNKENSDGEWVFISTVNKTGLAKIYQKLKIALKLKSDEISGGNVKGIVLWKIFSDEKVVEITTTIQPKSNLKVFEEIKMLINSNLSYIKTDQI